MLTFLTRTGDRAANHTSIMDMERTSTKIQDCTRKLTTGRKMDTFQDAGEYATRILDLETTLSSLEDYEQGETTVKMRLTQMEVIVRQINDISTDYRARLTRSTSYGVEDNVFQDYCTAQLKEVERLLNSQDSEGRYLFGGENTESPPVDVSLVVAPGIGNPMSMAYYKGTNSAPLGLIGDGETISYGMTANDAGFAGLINALAIGAANAPSQDPNTPQYQNLTQSAMPLMEQVSNNIPDALQDLGTKMKAVEQSEERQNAVRSYTKELLADITEASYVDTMIELNMASTALQFSLVAHQKLSENLNGLLDALRGVR